MNGRGEGDGAAGTGPPLWPAVFVTLAQVAAAFLAFLLVIGSAGSADEGLGRLVLALYASPVAAIIVGPLLARALGVRAWGLCALAPAAAIGLFLLLRELGPQVVWLAAGTALAWNLLAAAAFGRRAE